MICFHEKEITYKTKLTRANVIRYCYTSCRGKKCKLKTYGNSCFRIQKRAKKIDTVRTANTATDDPTEMARGDLYSKILFCPMVGGSAMKQQITVFLTFCERLPNLKSLEVNYFKRLLNKKKTDERFERVFRSKQGKH